MPKLPGRKSKDTSNNSSTSTRVALRAVDGTLRELGEKDLYLETKHKILRFRTLAKTQFRDKEGEQVRDSLLKPGDQLSVEVNGDDPETGLRVILTRKSTDAERARAEKPFDHDAAQAPVEADTRSSGATEVTEAPPARPEPDTGGNGDNNGDQERPTLAKTEAPEPTQPVEKAAPPAESPKPVSRPNASGDDIIGQTRDAADHLSEGLPNFLVQQITTRYFSRVAPPQWQVLDTVTAEVASVNGKEDYRNIRVNGKPSNRPVEKTGAWSTGEFQTTLDSLLDPYTQADFQKTRDDTLSGRSAWTYDFQVRQQNSNWDIHAPNGSVATPAYSGRIWIDKATFNVMRIEEQTGPFPSGFPFDKAETVVEYGFVNIDGKTYPLPIHSDILTCQRGSSTCTKNEIRFQNYRKFAADSSVTFDK